MRVDFMVHGVVNQHVGVSSLIEGEEQRALVQGLEVELAPVQSRHGSVTLRFFGKELNEAKEVFQPGRKVTMVIEAEDEAEEGPANG